MKMKTTNLNKHYLVLFKNPRDKGQAGILARQMFPSKWKAFLSVVSDAHRNPSSNLVVDLRPETPDQIMIRSDIMPIGEAGPIQVYII